MALLVRLVSEEDFPQLLKLGEKMRQGSGVEYRPGDPEAITQFMAALIEQPDCFAFALQADADVVGFMSGVVADRIYAGERTAVSDLFFIHPDHRSLKAALLLLKHFEQWATQKHADKLLVSTSTGIDLSPLLTRIGFVEVGATFERRL